LRKPSLAERVEPFLGGLHGRPSALVRSAGRSGIATKLAQRVVGFAPGDRDLKRRLGASGAARTVDQFRTEQTIWALTGAVGALVLALAAGAAGIVPAAASVPALALVAAVTGWLGRDWWLT
jgi:hypothetical protein